MKKSFIILIAIILSVTEIFAQDKIRAALDTLEKFYPNEKIYVLYDKSQYVAGESIWFSSFVFSGYDLSKISTNLFVELLDDQKHLILSKQLPIVNGQARGNLQLPERLPENVYFFRAYTQWMLNFPDSFQYIHVIPVHNPTSTRKLETLKYSWKATAFPEGGTLVGDVFSKIAIRLTSISALPPKWHGYIYEEGRHDTIADFQSINPAVAVTGFIPDAGHNYKILIEDEHNQKQLIDLPAVADRGVHLQVQNLNDSLIYTIQFRNVNTSAGYKLVSTMNDQLIYEAMIRRAGDIVRRSIPTNNLDNGILRLALFNNADSIVAERLCFIKPLSLAVKSPTLSEQRIDVAPRASSSFSFSTDSLENPYTLLVTDPPSESPVDDEDIRTALWLSNDLSSRVEDAPYYLSGTANAAEALDALLVTERWKWFDWNDILKNKFPGITHVPDNYLSYKGTVYRNKKPVSNEDVNLLFYFPDSSSRVVQIKTDSSGVFFLENTFFYDSVKVFYQLNSKKSSARNIQIRFEALYRDSPFNGTLPETSYRLVERTKTDSIGESIARAQNVLYNQQIADEKYQTLEEVKVEAKVKSAKDKLDEQLSSQLFRSDNEVVFDFVNEDQHAQGYPNMLQWLQGRVAGLRLEWNDSMQAYVPYLRNQQVGIYVNEMPVEPEYMNGFSASDVALIKVIKGYFVGGFMGGGGGAIAIYTRKGNMRTANVVPSLNNDRLKGYDRIAEFPQPDYRESFYKLIKKDTRDVLFWNSYLVSRNQLKIPVQFYNNDQAKSFRVTIIGFTPNGIPVFYNQIIK